MPFEVLGDSAIVDRNPYLPDDLLANPKRQGLPVDGQRHRLHEIGKRRQQGSRAGSRERCRPGRRAAASRMRSARWKSSRPARTRC
jgi:hypothetical protein